MNRKKLSFLIVFLSISSLFASASRDLQIAQAITMCPELQEQDSTTSNTVIKYKYHYSPQPTEKNYKKSTYPTIEESEIQKIEESSMDTFFRILRDQISPVFEGTLKLNKSDDIHLVTKIGNFFNDYTTERTRIENIRKENEALIAAISALNISLKKKSSPWVGSIPTKLNHFIQILNSGSLQQRLFNLDPYSGFLFYGPPGTGKTTLVDHIAKKLQCPVIKKTAADIKDSYYGETEKNIVRLFHEAIKTKQKTKSKLCIVFIDEIEGLVNSREEHFSDGSSINTTQTFLQIIEKGSQSGILFIGATNYLDKIDPAIKRSGRLEPIEINLPNIEARKELWQWYFNNHSPMNSSTPSEEKINEWARKSNNCSCADIAGIVRSAAMEAAISCLPSLSIQEITEFLEEADDITLNFATLRAKLQAETKKKLQAATLTTEHVDKALDKHHRETLNINDSPETMYS